MQKSIQVQLPSDADARPVAMLVQIASQYESKVYLATENKTINAKSIMGVMSMALNNGDTVTVSATGPDEEAALTNVTGYLSGEQHHGH